MSTPEDKIQPILIEEEMRNSYIDYSMSVIVARALPDIRDGLKPVHRRVLYGMLDLGLRPSSSYKKSARIVGEVLGKYHPHGDTAVYDAMVRMVQDFSMRYPLVDGQGNFGSVDGDSPAAMRYTEAKLQKIAEEVLKDLEKDTVDFTPNFDDSLKEPSVLPSLLPTLLINGATGIAVGMATNIPPHNLSEIIDALVALVARPTLKNESFKKYIQGPDFPTGGIIYGEEGIHEYFSTGRGKIEVRAKAHIEDMMGGRQRIIITEIPYQVNKATLQEKVASLVRDKKIDGITEIRDESDREGMRVVFELRKEVNSEKILNDLYKHTQMQTTFGVIMLALVNGTPKVLGIKDVLQEFLDFRHEVILRRIKFDLDKAEKRAHILEGLIIALDNIDEVIAIIKKSRSVDTARVNLMKAFKLSEIQAQAILDMRLQRLTGLERKKIEDEYKELLKLIKQLKALLASKPKRMQVVKEELLELKEKYGDSRRTQIISKTKKGAIKDMMKEDEAVVVMSNTGMVKRLSLNDYENIKDELKSVTGTEFTQYVFKTSNSHYFLFFTTKGRFHSVRSSFIPLAQNGDEGTPITRLLKLEKGEQIIQLLELGKFEEGQFIFLTTQQGFVKRIAVPTLSKAKEGGNECISLKDKDSLVSVELTNGNMEMIIASQNGMAIRFNEQDVRDMGLTAGGVAGINLGADDKVVDVCVVRDKKQDIIAVTDLCWGKRSKLTEFGVIKRGGKGIIAHKISDKVGVLVGCVTAKSTDHVYLVTNKGKVKRGRAKNIKEMARATQGVPVAKIAQKEKIVSVLNAPHFDFE